MQKIKKAVRFMFSRSFYLALGVAISISIYFAQAAWNDTVTDGTPLTPVLWNDLVAKVVDLDSKIGTSTVTIYKCPVNTTSTVGDWASHGCVGQITNNSTCINYTFSGGILTPTTIACSYLGVLRLKP